MSNLTILHPRYSTWTDQQLIAEMERLSLQVVLRRGPQEARLTEVEEEMERRRWRKAA